ncbi:MAG: DUF2029 domain-containing protein [Bradyrhizobium sp.]|uniref:glycosyltransferase family 87 protein n=1 Tax=Bradyrhizobium sp. TaxID=376 RepID=UPI001211EF87|nr:glycosyltransferase family 87 protein [Bradyrhizobium sp.]THD68739.1 MAG: DUF2029 domain-containing protein [Bradyrhizobium sp.]
MTANEGAASQPGATVAWLLVAIWSLSMIWTSSTAGVQHDYWSYLSQWNLVLSGTDPWSSDNAYGPLHNTLAYLLRFGPLAPKMFIVVALLVANALLAWELYRCSGIGPLYGVYALAVPTNCLVISMGIVYGLNDALVAALIVFAVVARIHGGMIVAGCLLGLAVLLKYYPIILVPMFALDAGRVRRGIVVAAAVVILIGMSASVLVWGDATFSPLALGVERGPKILSILSALSSYPSLIGGQRVLDILVKLNAGFVVTAGLASFLIAWKTRMHWLEASVLGLWAVLIAYKVGHQQFYLPWLFLVAALPLARTPSSKALAWVCVPMVLFLSAFQWGYANGSVNYPNALAFIRRDAGFYAFGLFVVTVSAYFIIRRMLEQLPKVDGDPIGFTAAATRVQLP